jgi:hypothetical protein
MGMQRKPFVNESGRIWVLDRHRLRGARRSRAIAEEGRQTRAMLRRRNHETFKQLLARLDLAIANATINDVYVDEVNPPRS